jgi:hypothetical protein
MLNVPDAPTGTRPPPPQKAPVTNETVDAAVDVPAAETNDPPLAPPPEPAPPQPPGRDRGGKTPEERMEEAIELWTIRSELARNTFLTNTGVNEEEVVRFDVLVEAMNLRIETSIAEWADLLRSEQVMPPEAAARMMNDISGAIVLTYDEMDRAMPPAWREDAGPKFQLFDFIDPRVATPLMGMEDQFNFE